MDTTMGLSVMAKLDCAFIETISQRAKSCHGRTTDSGVSKLQREFQVNSDLDETREHLEYVGLSDAREVSLGKIRANPARRLNEDGCLYGGGSQSRMSVIILAERERFELSVELLTLRRFSKPLLSTTQPPLRRFWVGL